MEWVKMLYKWCSGFCQKVCFLVFYLFLPPASPIQKASHWGLMGKQHLGWGGSKLL